MFVLKKNQIDTFEIARLPGFSHKMFTHIETNFYPLVKELGKEAIELMIAENFEHARKYNFITGYQICLFIDLKIMLGYAFDTDPQLVAITFLLNDTSETNNTLRIEKTYNKATEYIESILEKDEVFPASHLNKFINSQNQFAANLSAENFEIDILTSLRYLWENKFRITGETQLRLLIKNGISISNKFYFKSLTGKSYFIALMFLLGHEFYNDPKYSSLSIALKNIASINEAERINQLNKILSDTILTTIFDFDLFN